MRAPGDHDGPHAHGRGRGAFVLVFAGTDPLQYAGLEADLRHLDALSVEGAGVPTAHTVQGLDRVLAATPVDAASLVARGRAALREGSVKAVKIGMLLDAGTVRAVAETLEGFGGPVVLDPVLAATSGTPLLDDAGRRVLLDLLVPRATLVTPNLPELRALVPEAYGDGAARSLLRRGAGAVLVKGGHGRGAAEDRLVTAEGIRVFPGPRHAGPTPRGTGCALATAIAAGLARGLGLEASVRLAKDLVGDAIAAAQALGTRFLVLRPR